VIESIALALLGWLVIGACALPFIGRFLHMAEKDDDEGGEA